MAQQGTIERRPFLVLLTDSAAKQYSISTLLSRKITAASRAGEMVLFENTEIQSGLTAESYYRLPWDHKTQAQDHFIRANAWCAFPHIHSDRNTGIVQLARIFQVDIPEKGSPQGPSAPYHPPN